MTAAPKSNVWVRAEESPLSVTAVTEVLSGTSRDHPAVVPVVTAPGQSKGPLCREELFPKLKLLPLFPTVVYPSLESDEDNPVFKSRSKKRKSSDDAPYSPTGKSMWSVMPRFGLRHANLQNPAISQGVWKL